MVAVDALLDLLNARRRRYALYYLEEQSEPVPIEDVAEAVAAMEAENPAPIDVEMALHHNHLQKADEYEFIQYDSETGVIELVGSPPKFELLLTVANVLEQPE